MAAVYCKILQVRNIDERMNEDQFLNYCQNYANVTRYTWIPTKREAMVEMNGEGVNNFIQRHQNRNNLQGERRVTMIVTDAQIRSKELKTTEFNILWSTIPQTDQSQPRGRVLRVHASNMKLSVTARSIQRIFETIGKVELVAIMGPKPNDMKFEVLQCLIQYSKNLEAFRAYNKLDGKFIEELGCEIDIEMTDINELHVSYNSVTPLTIQQQPEHQVNKEGGPGTGNKVVRIRNLHNNAHNELNIVTPEMIYNVFSLYGHVVKIKLFLQPQIRGDHKEVSVLNAFVQMENHTEAVRAARCLNRFKLFDHWSQVMVSDMKNTVDPDTKLHTDRRFRLQYCDRAGPSRGEERVPDYNFFHRTNADFFHFKPTRIIRISNLPQNMNPEGIRRRMSELYGNVLALRFQGTSCDILFWSVNEATTALACEHGAILEGCRLSTTFLPIDSIPKERVLLSWPPSAPDER